MENNNQHTFIKDPDTKKHVVRVNGGWQEITTVYDNLGNILSKIVSPLRVEFNLKDVLQIILGASLLALPVGFTEETWNLGASLSTERITWFFVLSILFISLFVYYNSYRGRFRRYWFGFVKRVIFTYLFSFLVVALLLLLIDKTPWQEDWLLSLKRVLIVTFPCSLSAVIADNIK
jgi:uncharacterized membrane protein